MQRVAWVRLRFAAEETCTVTLLVNVAGGSNKQRSPHAFTNAVKRFTARHFAAIYRAGQKCKLLYCDRYFEG